MTTEDDARRAVDTELGRLHERFGAFDVTETTVENDPDFYEHGLDHVHRTGMLADAKRSSAIDGIEHCSFAIPLHPRRGRCRAVGTKQETGHS